MSHKIKKNYNNLITFGYGETNPANERESLERWLDAYGETVLGDGQDPDAYQEYRPLDLEGKWDFMKENEGLSEDEMFDNFMKWVEGDDYNPEDWYDEDHMEDELLNKLDYDYDFSEHDNDLSKIHDEFGPDSEDYDADNYMDRLTDFWNDNMSDGLRKRSSSENYDPDKDQEDKAWSAYVFKNTPWDDSENTKIGGIAKALTANDLGRSL